MLRHLAVAAILSSFAYGPATAASMIYQNAGVENSTIWNYSKIADGNLMITFMGATAGYSSKLGVIADGIDLGLGLSNSAGRGTTYDYGWVAAGSELIFYLDVATTGQRYFSNPALNGDGTNHLYSSYYGGGNVIRGQLLTRGAYVALGWEDMHNGGDLDYDDARYVVRDAVMWEPAPEPAVWATLIVGFGLVGSAIRRRSSAIRSKLN